MKKILLLLSAAAVMTSCSDSGMVRQDIADGGQTAEIRFSNTLPGGITRTTLTQFPENSQMQVYGIQSTDGSTDLSDTIFKKQLVQKGATDWTYSPLKYWNKNSNYEFYAIYPYNDKYIWNGTSKTFTVCDFLVEDAIASQTDIMIAEKNTSKPYNVVTMNFNHILSQINFYAKHNMTLAADGVASVKINKFNLTGIKKYGTFTQTGFNSGTGNVEGTWTSLNKEYKLSDFPGVGVTLSDNSSKGIVEDLLLCPQSLSVTLSVEYVVSYQDGTTATFVKSIPLESIMVDNEPLDEWEMNTIYNYTMTIDPTHTSDTIDYSKSHVDWDGTLNHDCQPTPNSSLIGPDDNNDFYIWVDTTQAYSGDNKKKVLWADLDGDGKEEGYIGNVDGDATADDSCPEITDGNSNNPDNYDAILIDNDGDGRCDKQLERTPVYVYGPENPTQYLVDWNGSFKEFDATSGTDGDAVVTNNSRLTQDADGTFYIEVQKDDNFDTIPDNRYAVVWADIDGDGKEEGFLGNQDGENINYEAATPQTANLVTDGDATYNPTGLDVILLDTDKDGTKCEKQLEREKNYIYGPAMDNQISFSAEVEGWSNTYNPEYMINQ